MTRSTPFIDALLEPPLIGPAVFWHAAHLENLPAASMLLPDAAARALGAARSLYDLDVIAAAPVEALAWAIRSSTMPGQPLVVIERAQRSPVPLAFLPDPEAVGESAGTVFVRGVVDRLRMLTPAYVALIVPTEAALCRALAAGDEDWAQQTVGAYIRAVAPSAPDVVLRIGDGARSELPPRISAFFDIPLLEVGTDDVPAPSGEEIARGEIPDVDLLVSLTEVPADTDPGALASRLRAVRATEGRAR